MSHMRGQLCQLLKNALQATINVFSTINSTSLWVKCYLLLILMGCARSVAWSCINLFVLLNLSRENDFQTVCNDILACWALPFHQKTATQAPAVNGIIICIQLRSNILLRIYILFGFSSRVSSHQIGSIAPYSTHKTKHKPCFPINQTSNSGLYVAQAHWQSVLIKIWIQMVFDFSVFLPLSSKIVTKGARTCARRGRDWYSAWKRRNIWGLDVIKNESPGLPGL